MTQRHPLEHGLGDGHWLDPVRAVLDSAASPMTVFFRDDDAGWADERLDDLLVVFDDHGVPIDVAVIPTELHPRLSSDLLRRHSQGNVHLHQHGYAHRNHQATGRKCEFGDARTASEQHSDIANGWARLQELLGEAVEPVFTPPWNRCGTVTADALADQGFAVLSRDCTAAPLPAARVRELPVTVDWFGRTAGCQWGPAERGRRIAASLGRGEPTGVMLHHAVTDDTERALIAELVAVVADHPAAKITHLLAVRP